LLTVLGLPHNSVRISFNTGAQAAREAVLAGRALWL